MNNRLLELLKDVFCGYAQLFLSNRATVGFFFFCGLLILSPAAGLLSLLGALTVTAVAHWLAPSEPTIKSGLFGVNGVLLGSVWVLFPEIPRSVTLTLTLFGSIAMAAALVPCARWMRRKRATFTVFSLPYVLMVWMSLLAVMGMGLYDRHLLTAWTVLSANRPAEALQAFTQAQVVTRQAESYRQDGLGWSHFHLKAYAQARDCFKKAIALSPKFADAHDGLGWANVKLGHFAEARSAFREAVTCDPMLADSWDGLGWTMLWAGQYSEARRCFARAVGAAPLFSDAYQGLYQSCTQLKETRAAEMFKRVGAMTQKNIAGKYQRVSSGQLLCWVLFFSGVLWYSRISAGVVVFSLAGCVVATHLFPRCKETLLDVNFIYNLLAILLALGGHYLTLRLTTLLWLGCVAIAMMACWGTLSGAFIACGWPLLCLPFNVLLIGSALLFSSLRRSRFLDCAVPLDVAVHAPEHICLWARKREISQKCWQKLAKSSASPLPTKL
jgi:urea transporter